MIVERYDNRFLNYVMLGRGPKAYSKAPTKEEKESLSRERGGGRDKIKFVNGRFENRQVV